MAERKFLDDAGLGKAFSLIKGYALAKSGGTITGDLTVEGTTTVQTPANDTDAATKKYVDDLVAAIESETGYTLPAATASVLGGIMVGEGLSVTGDGVLSADVKSDDLEAAIDQAVTGVSYSSGTLTVSKGDGTSSTASIPSITTFYKSGYTGYVLFSNNFIIQWGRISDRSSQYNSVTLPHAMADKNYIVMYSEYNIQTDSDYHSGNPYVNSLSTTVFKVFSNDEDYDLWWILVGTAAS